MSGSVYCSAECLSHSGPTVGCEHKDCIVEAAIRGESHAHEIVFDRLRRELLPRARRWCGCADVEDLTQECLLCVFEHLPELRCRNRLLGWSFRVLQNIFRMRQRVPASHPRELVSFDETTFEGLHWGDSQEEIVRAQETAERLTRYVNDLPPALRETFVLRVCSGLTTAGTARRLAISRMAVRQRLVRARRRLRNRLHLER